MQLPLLSTFPVFEAPRASRMVTELVCALLSWNHKEVVWLQSLVCVRRKSGWTAFS